MDKESIFCEKCGKYVELESEPEVLKNKTINISSTEKEMFVTFLVMAIISFVLIFFGMKNLIDNQITIDKKESIFVGDMSCDFEGATYLLKSDDFRLFMSTHPTYEGGELSVSDYTYSFPVSSKMYFGEAYTTVSDRYYDAEGNDVQDGAELTFYKNGNVKVDWCVFYWYGGDYTYTTVVEDEFDSSLVTCTGDYVRYKDALDKLESFEIQNSLSSNIFENIEDGELKTVEYFGCDEESDLYLSLSRDFEEKNTFIDFFLKDLHLSFYSEEEICYDEEKIYFIDAYDGTELPHKTKKNGTKQYNLKGCDGYYELRFIVSEDDIKVECSLHDTDEDFSYSSVIDEDAVQRRTRIINY